MNASSNDNAYPSYVGGEHAAFYILIHDVSRLQRTLFDRMLKPLHITRAQWWLLKTLAISENGSLNQTELARLMSAAKANTGKLIAKMEPLKLVARSSNPNDGRAQHVQILAQGLATLAQTQALEVKLSVAILQGIDQPHLKTAAHTLEQAKINIYRKHIGVPSNNTMPSFIHKVESSSGQADPNWLGFLVHDVSRLRLQVIEQLLKPLGLSRAQWRVLNYLNERDGLSQIDLAKELDISRSALGTLVVKLEDNKLASKYPDPEDSRRNRVFLTKAGRQLTQSIKSTSAQAEDFVLSGINATDIDITATALNAMKRNLLALISASV